MIEQRLCALLREAGVECCPYEDMRGQISSINSFEKKIGRARIIVILYSKGYFTSSHCMNEYAHIIENADTEQYVRLINCDNVKFTEEFKKELDGYWWAEKGKNRRTDPKTLKEEKLADWNHHYYMDDNDKYSITYLEDYFKDNPNYKVINGSSDDELKALVFDIKGYIDTHPQTSYDELPKLNFATRRKDQIVPRVAEAKKIKELFETESIVNMVGWGGCGKSTISEYFVNEYGNDFSQITGITINNDFYEDICKVYTEQLNVPYEYVKVSDEFVVRQERQIDYISTYNKILSKLDEYPILDGKYNLIIFDVNETVGVSGYERITDAISLMESRKKTLLKNWKVLVIAREKLVKRSRIFELVEADKADFTVLREIFFKYLEPIWHDSYKEPKFSEGALKNLFERLDNCALLVEQLARFLNRDAAMSYQEIVDYLEIGGNLTLQSYMSRQDIVSMNDQEKRNEKVGFFLSRLISYADLDGNKDCDILKKIVRLFVVWERVYHSADEVIYFLVDKSRTDQHVIKQEKDYIIKCLGRLVDKRILDSQVVDGKIKKYQIHGMIAATCRDQIFANPKFCDFSDYITIIDAFDGKDDVIKEKCIFHSLANYVSFDESYLLKKAHEYMEKNIYERALKIKYLKIKTAYQISEKEIYSMFEKTEFKNSYADELYFNWLYKESGYSSVLDCHKPLANKSFVAKMIQDMVRIDDGTQRDMLVFTPKKNFITWFKSLFKSDKVNEPIRRVVKGFCICKYQVTQGLWYEVMLTNPSRFGKDCYYPVENISWYDSLAFIMELNQITGMTFGFPTEKQWEFAASCNGKYEYAGTNDEDRLEEYAWYNSNSGSETHIVGTRKPNDFGLYDMSGNVWEWCQDWHMYGSSRVLRGGSWYYGARHCRVSSRDDYNPNYGGSNYGLRLALPCSSPLS